jgi:hypothetical protein
VPEYPYVNLARGSDALDEVNVGVDLLLAKSLLTVRYVIGFITEGQ